MDTQWICHHWFRENVKIPWKLLHNTTGRGFDVVLHVIFLCLLLQLNWHLWVRFSNVSTSSWLYAFDPFSGYRHLPSASFEAFLDRNPLSFPNQLLRCAAWKCLWPCFLHLSGTQFLITQLKNKISLSLSLSLTHTHTHTHTHTQTIGTHYRSPINYFLHLSGT